jgi:hypothetical protein
MAKIQIRRGTLAQLNSLTSSNYLDVGELGFTTDTGEVYIGTGTTSSTKHLIGQAYVATFASRPAAGVSGRLFHASDTGGTYIDDGSNWIDVSSGVNDLDSISDGTTYGRVLNTDLSSNHVNKISDTTNTVTASQARSHINDAGKHREINDSGSATTDLWSADKIGSEIASIVSGIDPQDSVIDQLNLVTSEPVSLASGDRYINTASGLFSETTTISGTANYIYEWEGATWIETVPTEGMHTWNETIDAAYIYNGTAWVKFGSTVTHNNLSGKQGGTEDEYYHLTNTEYSGLHIATTVSGTASINMSIIGQEISADLLVADGGTFV